MKEYFRKFQKGNNASTSAGLMNVSDFEKVLAKTILQYSQQGYIVVKFDIDRFRELSHRYGKDKGQQLLAELVKAVEGRKEKDYAFAQIGTDRFVILAENTPNFIADLHHLLKCAVDNLPLDNYVGIVKFTFGGYEISNAKEPTQDIMNKVKIAHRMAKIDVSKVVIWYSDGLAQSIEQEKYFDEQLMSSIKKNQFGIFLQGQVDLKTNTLVAAEALARWILPSGRTIYPGSFVPQFEKNGLIRHLDYHILELVCEYLAQLRKAGEKLFRISLNISNITLSQEDFVDRFTQIVDKYSISHEYISMEVHEVSLVAGEEFALENLMKMNELGFPLAMDAFASGYSSLRILPELPIMFIKLDRNFLRGNDKNARTKIVIESIINLSHNLGIEIICEGVEHQRDMELLNELGCDYAQGYYISKPTSSKEFLEVIMEDVKKL